MLFKLLNLFNNRRVIVGLYALLVLLVGLKHLHGMNNNYFIFKYAFFHAVKHLDLYAQYPAEHFDTNHYGPLFSLFFAPFALLPDWLGMMLWVSVMVVFLMFAVSKLPLGEKQINAIYWIIAHELLTAMFSYQFNIAITGIIILSYVYIADAKYGKASFLIMLGTFIKLYGIVGLAFFFFARDKGRLIMWLAIWAAVMFVLPMPFFGVSYILNSYQGWMSSLATKTALNSVSLMQDISVMGLFRRIFHHPEWATWPFLLTGMFFYSLPYLRTKLYGVLNFRLLLLSATLIFAVIFSNSSESPTYIIAFAGVAIWFVIQEGNKKPLVLSLFILALLLTSFSPSDLFPKYIRVNYIIPYALKALPCLLIWCYIVYQQLSGDFSEKGEKH